MKLTINAFNAFNTLIVSLALVLPEKFAWTEETGHAVGTVSVVNATLSEQVFLETLLDRGLFRLAEVHCRERLASDSLSDAGRAELTLELIRILQEYALATPRPEKDEMETRIQRIYDDFHAENPDSPWGLVVDFQYAVGLFARARMQEMEARFSLNAEERMERAREVLRQSIAIFHDVDSRRETQTMILAQDKKTVPSADVGKKKIKNKAEESFFTARPILRFSNDGLSLWELESLKLNVQYQLLLAFELQAQTYEKGTLDRLASLKEAQSQARGLTMMPTNSAIYWNARLAEIRCFRLQEDFVSAQKRVDSLLEKLENMPREMRLEFVAERIRIALAQKKIPEALDLVKTVWHNDIIGQNGELDCAILEIWLARWSMTLNDANGGENESDDATKYRDEAVGILNAIREKSAPWWVRRAEIAFDGMLKTSGSTQDISFLKMATENACANHDADALLACERLWEVAVAQKDIETALMAVQLAGAYCFQNGDKDTAVQWFRKMAIQFPENDESMREHARAVAVAASDVAEALNATTKSGGEARFDAELDGKLDRYQVLLLEHFQCFGKKDPKYLGFLRQLAQVTRIRGNLAECVDVYMVIEKNTPPESDSRAIAEAECFGVWRDYLEELERVGASEYTRALFTAVAWVETLPKSEARARGSFYFLCALENLNSELNVDKDSAKHGETNGNREDGKKASLQEEVTQAERRLFEGMKPFLNTFPDEIREEAEQIGTFALLSDGNTAEAFPFYEKIAQKFPNRLEVQLTWGRLLSEKALSEGTKSRKMQALAQWRNVSAHVVNRTSEWFEAKYWVIRFQLELGEKTQAQRLLRTFRALNPDLGGEKWRTKFEALEED